MRDEVRHAIKIVKDGGVIIYPTDTACGIGCRIDNAEAVERVFAIKGRDTSKATPVLFSSVEMVRQYVSEIPVDVQETLMERYWPGALTIILSAQKEKVNEMIRGGGDTIGTRIPNFPDIITLIEEVGVPIIGTSANFSGEPSIFSTKELSQELLSLVDYVLPGDCTVK
jgi:L-threonylcarbamoyladenylate synthase